eukprot:3574804-Prymnesium_polylepis.3
MGWVAFLLYNTGDSVSDGSEDNTYVARAFIYLPFYVTGYLGKRHRLFDRYLQVRPYVCCSDSSPAFHIVDFRHEMHDLLIVLLTVRAKTCPDCHDRPLAVHRLHVWALLLRGAYQTFHLLASGSKWGGMRKRDAPYPAAHRASVGSMASHRLHIWVPAASLDQSDRDPPGCALRARDICDLSRVPDSRCILLHAGDAQM